LTEAAPAPCGTGAALPDDGQLLRSIAHDPDALEWFADEQRWLPTAKAMQFDPDCSMFWRQHLQEVHDQAPECVTVGKRPLVFEVRAGSARNLEFGAEHSPDGDTPIACAHSSLEWPGGGPQPPKPVRNALRSDLVRHMELIVGEILLPPPPAA
jgi:hypothetical protein